MLANTDRCARVESRVCLQDVTWYAVPSCARKHQFFQKFLAEGISMLCVPLRSSALWRFLVLGAALVHGLDPGWYGFGATCAAGDCGTRRRRNVQGAGGRTIVG